MQSAAPQEQEEQHFALLALPEPLLLAVLQCLAIDRDQRSLLSAARAHSRLRQAAVQFVSSITVGGISQQQVLDGVLLYLDRHGQHLSSVSLRGAGRISLALHQLPPQLQLTSLQLQGLRLQLLPGGGFQGVLGPAAGLSALKQLRITGCSVLDDHQGSLLTTRLASALQQLWGLEQLSWESMHSRQGWRVGFSTAALQRLQRLTSLDLPYLALTLASGSFALQPLQGLTRLADLRIYMLPPSRQYITAGMLSGASNLSQLQLQGTFTVEPGVLAGKARLRHLYLLDCSMIGGSAGIAQLLSHLQPLQLTHLFLHQCVLARDAAQPTAAAYSALTASSELHQLCLNSCRLPAGVWQHLFPADRQLPHLTLLDVAGVEQTGGGSAAVPEGSRLVTCCPNLQHLRMASLDCTAQLLAPLTSLSPGLHTLRLTARGATAGECLGVVWQLTGLRELAVFVYDGPEGLLLPTTQLRQLTKLSWFGRLDGAQRELDVSSKSPDDQPVWRQVLQLHLNHSDPAVAQAAAAALEAV